MKYILPALLLNFFFTFQLNAQKSTNLTRAEITIGDANQLNSGLPVYPAFEYSYSQSIYLQSEIGDADVISKIWYNFGGVSLSKSNNWTIYMGHTTKTQFDSISDWTALEDLTQVYSGTFPNPEETGWIEFDITDFDYNGTDNLIIAVDENASGADEFADNHFYSAEVSTNRSILDYSDSDDINPASPPDNANLDNFVPNIKLFKGVYPSTDACIDKITAPIGFTWQWESGNKDIIVTLTNKGTADLTQATINWSVNGTAQTAFEWSGNLAENQSESLTIGNFNFSLSDSYIIDVEADAEGDGNPANNSQSITFVVTDAFLTNYEEGFESFVYPQTPDYWALETHSVAWIVDDRLSHSGENCLRTFYNSDGTTAKDDWAFMPYLRLVGGESYQISFWVHAAGWEGVPESLELYVGKGTNSASMTTALWSNSNLLTEDWEEVTAYFTPSETGNYVFGWHANSVADVDDIAVDDISVLGATGIEKLNSASIKIYPNPAQNKVFIHTPDTYNLQISDISGRLILQTVVDKTTTVELEQSGLYFFRIFNSDTQITRKVIIK